MAEPPLFDHTSTCFTISTTGTTSATYAEPITISFVSSDNYCYEDEPVIVLEDEIQPPVPPKYFHTPSNKDLVKRKELNWVKQKYLFGARGRDYKYLNQ